MSIGTTNHAARGRVCADSVSSAAPEPQDELQRGKAKPNAPIHCRTNSRRGATDPAQRSYPPVQSVRRAFRVLRAVNDLRIASVHSLHKVTGFPKPTIVRLLETLLAEGYVARDNMCGGYGVTRRVHELTSGYQGISQVLDAARGPAVELTQRLKWPIGIGVLDGDAIAIKFWTGTISPWAHTNTVLGLRPDFATTAMGRAYLAFCPEAEREQRLREMRADPTRNFEEADELHLRALLQQARHDGYTMRDPKTKPYRTTTIGMPIREGEVIHALINISFFTTALAKTEIASKIVSPLRATTKIIEDTIAAMNSGAHARHEALDLELAF
jgi:IclR family mhp operon transcriptional activator